MNFLKSIGFKLKLLIGWKYREMTAASDKIIQKKKNKNILGSFFTKSVNSTSLKMFSSRFIRRTNLIDFSYECHQND